MRRVLIPSPFVGPNSWAPVAAMLDDATVVALGELEGDDLHAAAARRIADRADDQLWIAVLHSSAGPFAPSLAAAAANLTGLVFVDAVLPHPGRSAAEIAPAGQMKALRGAAVDGLLPRWDRWFPRATLEAWVPRDEARASFLSDIPQVPLAFLEATAPDLDGWEALPAAYVRLSDGFEAQAARADAGGWPVRRLDLGHLGMASAPREVAAVLAGLPPPLG